MAVREVILFKDRCDSASLKLTCAKLVN